MSVRRWLSLAIVIPVLAFAACAPAAPAPPAEPPPEPAPAAPAPEPAPAAPAPEPKPEEPPEPDVDEVTDFYEGQTITLIAGSSPGGGTDTIARAVARHLGRFIPGNPTIIVQNMAGAGGVTALNAVAGAAPDGLTFNGSLAQTQLFAQLRGEEQARYDLTTVTWIGTVFTDEPILWLRSDTPYTDVDAIRQAATPPKLGAQAGAHPSVVRPRVADAATGLKFDVVTGYPGSPEILLDVERGALDGRFDGYGSISTQRPEWFEENFIRVVISGVQQRHPEFPDQPSLFELIPPENRVYESLFLAPELMSRAMVGPPGIPTPIAKSVQDAYAEMARDAEFIAEVERTAFDAVYASPEELSAAVNSLLQDDQARDLLLGLLDE